jgi:hypothetical protein
MHSSNPYSAYLRIVGQKQEGLVWSHIYVFGMHILDPSLLNSSVQSFRQVCYIPSVVIMAIFLHLITGAYFVNIMFKDRK